MLIRPGITLFMIHGSASCRCSLWPRKHTEIHGKISILSLRKRKVTFTAKTQGAQGRFIDVDDEFLCALCILAANSVFIDEH
jgi:hypothetical protein